MTDNKKPTDPKGVTPASELTDEELQNAVGGLSLSSGSFKQAGAVGATLTKGSTFNTANGGNTFRTLNAGGSFNTADAASGIQNLGKLKR